MSKTTEAEMHLAEIREAPTELCGTSNSRQTELTESQAEMAGHFAVIVARIAAKLRCNGITSEQIAIGAELVYSTIVDQIRNANKAKETEFNPEESKGATRLSEKINGRAVPPNQAYFTIRSIANPHDFAKINQDRYDWSCFSNFQEVGHE